MTIGIHQPEYLPWPGFFNKILKSEAFVILDNVQFSRGGVQNRNRIKTARGVKWLTVPLAGHQMLPIKDVNIDNSRPWSANHFTLLKGAYKNSLHFSELLDFFEDLYLNQKFTKLVDLNLRIIKYLMDYLGLKTKLILASSLKSKGQRTDLLLDICRKTGSDVYLSGQGGKRYLEEEKFKANGIQITYRDFAYPTYQQQFDEFVPNLSIVDMICNLGKTETLKLIS